MGLAIFKGWMTGILGGIVVAVIWCLAIDMIRNRTERRRYLYDIVLPSFWKVLLWFLCTARRCTDIKIFTA